MTETSRNQEQSPSKASFVIEEAAAAQRAIEPTRRHASRWRLAGAVLVLVLLAKGASEIAANPNRAARELLQVQLYNNLLNLPIKPMTQARELLRSLAERPE